MKEQAYKVFVDVWRLACKYRFLKLDDSQWECFIADGGRLLDRYRGTTVEQLFRKLFIAVQALYEKR